LDLVKARVETELWDKNEGWLVARDGNAYYASLRSRRSPGITRTDSLGRFKISYPDQAPVKLRFIKEADAAGHGFFDGESAWGTTPNYYRIIMEAADYMVKEADILALLPDWEAYSYSVGKAHDVNYPACYYLGEENEALRGYSLHEIPDEHINCNTFSQAIITQAWFLRYPQFRWSKENWEGFTILDVPGFDPFGPMTESLRSDGQVFMAVMVDISDNQPPPRWSLIQGWNIWDWKSSDGKPAKKEKDGHSFIIIDHHPGTDKILTIEANKGYRIDGVGMRSIGNLSGQKQNGLITPNKDRLWVEKPLPTWQKTKGDYCALADTAHNPNNQPNPIGIVRLKVYDLQWSGAEVL
jgi:hypothetical protein